MVVVRSPAAQTHLLFDTLGDSVRLAAPEFVKLGQESPGLLTFQDVLGVQSPQFEGATEFGGYNMI